ncbi:MAG: hypothetical protein R3E12_04725 [Candidatus Eisenbacteria bacterium]
MGTTIELQMRAERIGPFTRGPLLHLDAPADTSLQTQLHTILEILCQHPPGKQHPDRRVVFQARWSLPGGRVDGLSIGLPFYLAAWAALADRRSSTKSRFLAPYLAATGCVQGGEVLPVNGDTLASKVEAAFFAPVLRLMVPEVQKKEAVAEVHRLRASHPGRQLVILGVRELPRGEEFPGMVVTRQRRPREVAGRLLREWMVHGGVATITALLAALSAAVIVLFFWVTKNEPIDAAWSDEHLTTTNRHGRIVGKFPFPPGKPVGWQGGRFASRSTYIANLDHEGKNEILTFLWDRNQKADRLAAIDRHGRLIWVRRAGTLDDRVVDAWEDQNWSDLLVFPDPLLPQQILTIRRSITGPLSVLASIDPRSGKALGILQNAGHLEDLYAVELPEVESGLVLAVGTHNPSRSGIAILFDPAGFCVESAERLPWSTDSTQVGTRPWSAILMPPDVFTSGTRVSACDVGRERDGLLRIAVRGESRGDVNYYFEIGAFRRIGLRAVQITDGYKQKLRESGSGLDESDFHNEEERLLRGTRWLTPTGWHDFDPDRRQNGKPQ